MVGEGGKAETAKGGQRAAKERAKNPTRLSDLRPDTSNRRRRTARGAQLLTDALREIGAARSIVIDETGEVLAGNGVVEAAAAAGLDRVKVVETDGQTVIAVRRSGLTPEQKRRLAMYDNRAGELAEWDPSQIGADVSAGLEMQPFFSETELRKIVKDGQPQDLKVEEVQTSEVADRFWISVRGPLKAQAKALQQLRALMADLDGVQVELGTTATEDLQAL